ncbi:FAD/NAD(P)-binding oxidoreductase isoform 1 [Dorcoceras hygrometricum]|uniref:cytochrome-b5 reductase n=1 Tax=Dorcoceras hygrometricum TaxID=472368 RepID=A0A2Z7AEL1_9LAMI|nr:FAD/NAD(P)-binding oxidoreductase isoform 1 [Dorcoceras hygrometricum]
MSREGDWMCPACQHLNFKKRDPCQRCSCPKNATAAEVSFQRTEALMPGDWYCGGLNCGAHNYASRVSCYRCGALKDYCGYGAGMLASAGYAYDAIPGWKSGDWICTRSIELRPEMAVFFRRFAKSVATAVAFGSQPKSTITGIRFGTLAAVSAGISSYYYFSSPNLVYLDQLNEDATPKFALNPDKWIEFKLQDKVEASHNTQLFRFSFDPNLKLGLDVASCIITRAPKQNDADGQTKYVIRPYTPISDPDAKGYFDLLIKVYPEGNMSQHFASLKPGDVVEVKGPIEKLKYSPNMKKHIGMIAGGTGITPMLQLIDAIVKNPDDNTQVFYTVDKPTNDWHGGTGYISKDMVVKGLPSPSDDILILVCGPPGLMNHISGDKAKDRSQGELTGVLKEIGFTENMVFKF